MNGNSRGGAILTREISMLGAVSFSVRINGQLKDESGVLFRSVELNLAFAIVGGLS